MALKSPKREWSITYTYIHIQLLSHDPLRGPASPLTIAVATANLNARIRSQVLFAREMWTQHDQFSNHQIPLKDQDIILRQYELRKANHSQSEKSKAPAATYRPFCPISVGDLVHLYSDRNKSRARDRYLVVAVNGAFCNVRKLVGSQLRSTSYRVKISVCYQVPSEVLKTFPPVLGSASESSSDETSPPVPSRSPQSPPTIPRAISSPATQEITHNEDLTVGDNASPTTQTSPNPEDNLCASIGGSDAPRPTRARHHPTRYSDFVTDFVSP